MPPLLPRVRPIFSARHIRQVATLRISRFPSKDVPNAPVTESPSTGLDVQQQPQKDAEPPTEPVQPAVSSPAPSRSIRRSSPRVVFFMEVSSFNTRNLTRSIPRRRKSPLPSNPSDILPIAPKEEPLDTTGQNTKSSATAHTAASHQPPTTATPPPLPSSDSNNTNQLPTPSPSSPPSPLLTKRPTPANGKRKTSGPHHRLTSSLIRFVSNRRE
ncbi:hypothetical protein BJ508DRAFT_324847 [Ascobolus immersus RN42]|uniref:Uncharacterized protein n=1 Tax=Ascobolus immersus RN42 TaxID=1160509 RepID=A0A3N4IB02_ASCIM|nr:hypothetical protein BJ508DRAFT_324847 [Ascobolus immersus RN42]